MQDEFCPFHVHRVTGVVPALVPRDSREMWRQHVDDLSFAFVAPLRAQHCDVCGHAGYIVIRPLGGFGETFRTTPTWGQSTVTIRLTY